MWTKLSDVFRRGILPRKGGESHARNRGPASHSTLDVAQAPLSDDQLMRGEGSLIENTAIEGDERKYRRLQDQLIAERRRRGEKI